MPLNGAHPMDMRGGFGRPVFFYRSRIVAKLSDSDSNMNLRGFRHSYEKKNYF
jgi:hypothetical protein